LAHVKRMDWQHSQECGVPPKRQSLSVADIGYGRPYVQ